MRLLFTTVGLTLALLGVFSYVMAQRNRNPGSRGVTFVPIWKMKDRYNGLGYRYLWVGTLSLAVCGIMGVWLALT
jgi:hypothetical protein